MILDQLLFSPMRLLSLLVTFFCLTLLIASSHLDEVRRIDCLFQDEDWAEMFRPGGSKQKEPPVKRALLKRRDYKIDLDSKLGKSVVITKNTPSAQAGG